MELVWPSAADEALRGGVYRIIHDVVESGGAIGYLSPPPRAETDAWLDDVLASVSRGDAALAVVPAVAPAAGRPAAIGLWRRGTAAVYRHSAEIQKVMTHPGARGRGLGRAVVAGLVDDARAAGIETLMLGVRGTNHGAIALYERLGFREYGRLPNVIAVGAERFDDVGMYLELPRPPGVLLRGSHPDYS